MNDSWRGLHPPDESSPSDESSYPFVVCCCYSPDGSYNCCRMSCPVLDEKYFKFNDGVTDEPIHKCHHCELGLHQHCAVAYQTRSETDPTKTLLLCPNCSHSRNKYNGDWFVRERDEVDNCKYIE